MTHHENRSEKLVIRPDHAHLLPAMFVDPDPSASEFKRLAQLAIERMPNELAQKLEDVVIKVEEFATAEQLASVDLSDRWRLSGLYEGRPLTEQSVWESGAMPAIIHLFRQPLLAEMRETGVSLEEIVRHVTVHEAGHHFGFSDEDMHALEDSVRD